MPPAFKAFITGTFKSIDVDGTSKGRAKIKGRKVKDKNRPWISHCSIKKCASTFFQGLLWKWLICILLLLTHKIRTTRLYLKIDLLQRKYKDFRLTISRKQRETKGQKIQKPICKKRTFAEFPIMKHDYAVSRIWLFVIESNEVKQNCNDFPHQINQKIVWLKETIALSKYSNWLNYIFFLVNAKICTFRIYVSLYSISFDDFLT